jgi:hypothetical protein
VQGIGPRPAGTPALQIRWRRRGVTKLAKQSITVHVSMDEPDGTGGTNSWGTFGQAGGSWRARRDSEPVAATDGPTYAVG